MSSSIFAHSRVLKIIAWLVSLYVLVPIVLIVIISFGESRYLEFPPSDYSLRWYSSLIEDPSWFRSLYDSLLVALPASLIGTVIGINSALFTNFYKGKWAIVLQSLVLAPLILPGIVYAVSLYFYFSNLGIVETHLALAIAHSCICIPISYLIINSGIARHGFDLETAALTLGAKPLFILFKVTLPRIRNQIIASLVFCFVTSFDEPVINLFITGNTIVTLPKRMWDGIRFEIDPSVAAMSTVLIFFVILVVALQSMSHDREA